MINEFRMALMIAADYRLNVELYDHVFVVLAFKLLTLSNMVLLKTIQYNETFNKSQKDPFVHLQACRLMFKTMS